MKTSNDTRALTGIAGQRDDRSVRDPARTLRHARLHRHLDEVDLPAQSVLDDFIRTGADPAGGDDQVGVSGVAVERGAELVDVVTGHRRCDHVRARIADGRGEHERVGLVDLTGFQRGAGRDQLRAGRHHQYPLPRNDCQLAEAQCRGKTEHRGRDDLPCPQHGGAGRDVLTGAADVLSGLGGRADRDGVRRAVGGLDRNHSGGTGRDRRTRHDPVCRTGFQRQQIGAAGGDVLGDRQQHRLFGAGPGDIVGNDRVAVHGRVVEARQRQRRQHLLGQHQPERVAERHADGRARRDQAGDDAPVLLDRTHQTGYVTPVNSSDTLHSRRWMSSSCDCALDSTTFG